MATESKPKEPTDAAIRAMLVMTDGNRTAAADRLRISRVTMLRRIGDMTEKPEPPKSSGRPKKEPVSELPKPPGHLHRSGFKQPMVSALLTPAINESLDNGVQYEELIHRCSSMILQITQLRIHVQRQERLAADCAGKRWTPERLRGVQDRLVNARFNADGTEPDGTEPDGTDEDEEDDAD